MNFWRCVSSVLERAWSDEVVLLLVSLLVLRLEEGQSSAFLV
jgi:hypothetical protein